MKRLIIVMLILCHYISFSQKKEVIKQAIVTGFEDPYTMITVSWDDNDDFSFRLAPDANFRNKKGKSIPKEEIAEGSNIKLEYEMRENKRTVVIVELLSESLNGKTKFKGRFDGYENGIAFIDGRKVMLTPNTRFQGAKKGQGAMNILLEGFEDMQLKKGYIMEVEGEDSAGQLVKATEIIVRKNIATKEDKELKQSLQGHYDAKGLTQVSKVPNSFKSANALYNGSIQIGQFSYKLYNDINVQGYVNMIGYKILQLQQTNTSFGSDEKIDFRFYVIDDAVPNAYAWANGMVFIHTGLLKIIENEAQLAFVLSHEIAHILYEHGSERYKKSKMMQEALDMKDVALKIFDKKGNTSNTINTILSGGKKKNTTQSGDTSDASYAEYFQQMTGLEIGSKNNPAQKMAAMAMAKISQKLTPDDVSGLFGKHQESQADRVGLYYAWAAGYDVTEVPKFWKKMMEINKEQTFIEKIGTGFKQTIKSTSFKISTDTNIKDQLLASSSEMLLETVLRSVYTTHPATKTRYENTNRILSTTYKNVVYDASAGEEDKYKQYLSVIK